MPEIVQEILDPQAQQIKAWVLRMYPEAQVTITPPASPMEVAVIKVEYLNKTVTVKPLPSSVIVTYDDNRKEIMSSMGFAIDRVLSLLKPV